jgi:hypothetical protein
MSRPLLSLFSISADQVHWQVRIEQIFSLYLQTGGFLG